MDNTNGPNQSVIAHMLIFNSTVVSLNVQQQVDTQMAQSVKPFYKDSTEKKKFKTFLNRCGENNLFFAFSTQTPFPISPSLCLCGYQDRGQSGYRSDGTVLSSLIFKL